MSDFPPLAFPPPPGGSPADAYPTDALYPSGALAPPGADPAAAGTPAAVYPPDAAYAAAVGPLRAVEPTGGFPAELGPAGTLPGRPASGLAGSAPLPGRQDQRSRRVRKAKRIAVIFGLVSALAAATSLAGWSFVSGWAASNRAGNATIKHVAPEQVVIAVPEYGQRSGVQMPDVRGLSEQDARQALADAGVPGEIVTVEERPAAGKAGVVIQQAPVQGVSIDSTAQVLLVLSTPAVVPAVVGKTPAEGAAELMGMGVRVVQTRVYQPGAPLGRIVSTEPAAGAELPEEIAFNVADSPAELQLADKDTSIGSVRAYSNVEVEGKAYDRAIELTGRDDTPATASWLIGGNGVELVGAVALDDNTGADQQAVLQILGDSRELYRGGVNLKTPVALPALDVTGVQTITLVVTAVAPPDRYYAVTVSLLDLKLLASYDQIAAIR